MIVAYFTFYLYCYNFKVLSKNVCFLGTLLDLYVTTFFVHFIPTHY